MFGQLQAVTTPLLLVKLATRRHDVIAGLIPAGFVLLSILVAFASTRTAYLAWLLIFPAEMLLDRFIPDPRHG